MNDNQAEIIIVLLDERNRIEREKVKELKKISQELNSIKGAFP